MQTQIPMTPEGHLALTEELQRLKSTERPRIVKAIEVARAHGDLSENAEYHAAKDEQGLIEARIREIESKIASAQVIDPKSIRDANTVRFGATVTLVDVDTDEEVTYKIVGEDEADIKDGKININSPVAKGIIGREVGDEVEIRTPGGKRTFEVIDLQYA